MSVYQEKHAGNVGRALDGSFLARISSLSGDDDEDS